MTTFETNFTTIDPEVFLGQQWRGRLSDADFSWQPITMRTFKQRMEDARLVFNDGFANNPMLLSQSAEEYRFQAGAMMWVMDQRLSTVIYH